MNNKNVKKLKKGVGRPKYELNFELAKELYKKIDNKEITNEQAWKIAKCRQDKMVSAKTRIWKKEGMI